MRRHNYLVLVLRRLKYLIHNAPHPKFLEILIYASSPPDMLSLRHHDDVMTGVMIPYLGPAFMVLRESGNTNNQQKPKNERLHFKTLDQAKEQFQNYFTKQTDHDFDGKKFKPGKGKYAYVSRVYDVKMSPEEEKLEMEKSTLEPRVKELVNTVGMFLFHFIFGKNSKKICKNYQLELYQNLFY